MCGSLVIVGGIIGGYGMRLVQHQSAGWAGIAFVYIYDINFSYSFGWSLPRPGSLRMEWIGLIG